MNSILSRLPLLMGAPAGGADAGPASIVPTLVTFGLVFLIFYFLIIRPQNKKQKDQKQMLSALKKGDRVATIGGIRGTIQSLKEDTIVLKVDTNTTLEFSRSAVSSVLQSKGSSSKSQAKAEKAVEASSETPEEGSEKTE